MTENERLRNKVYEVIYDFLNGMPIREKNAVASSFVFAVVPSVTAIPKTSFSSSSLISGKSTALNYMREDIYTGFKNKKKTEINRYW